MAIPYSITVSLFGGTAPHLQDWVSAHIGRSAFDGYVVLVLLITAATGLTLPETRGTIRDRESLTMRLLQHLASNPCGSWTSVSIVHRDDLVTVASRIPLGLTLRHATPPATTA